MRAAAATALSFLACHPIGARGDACLTGPHRKALVSQVNTRRNGYWWLTITFLVGSPEIIRVILSFSGSCVK